MVDHALAGISGAPTGGITFQWFRSTFMEDHDLKDSLNYGHAVPDTVAKLDQYLYTYGPMIESQWECVDHVLRDIPPPERWIDYGCGQGLAGLLVNDLTGGRLVTSVGDILLIEPSALALARAAALYARIAPGAAIGTVCKRFDDVTDQDVASAPRGHTLHLFSNSLDVRGFDALRLLRRTLRRGRHTILSVSHDRSFNGGTPQIEATKAALEHLAASSGWSILRSMFDRFTCSNPSRSKGVVWRCELEIP